MSGHTNQEVAEMTTASKLALGRRVATINVDAWMAEAPSRRAGVAECLIRHASGDWGCVCPEDAELNDEALVREERILSAYKVDGRKLWVITEWDRSITTVLFPEEY